MDRLFTRPRGDWCPAVPSSAQQCPASRAAQVPQLFLTDALERCNLSPFPFSSLLFPAPSLHPQHPARCRGFCRPSTGTCHPQHPQQENHIPVAVATRICCHPMEQGSLQSLSCHTTQDRSVGRGQSVRSCLSPTVSGNCSPRQPHACPPSLCRSCTWLAEMSPTLSLIHKQRLPPAGIFSLFFFFLRFIHRIRPLPSFREWLIASQSPQAAVETSSCATGRCCGSVGYGADA